MKFTKEQLEQFPKQVQEYLEVYCWLSQKSGKYCFCSDSGKYCNHSDNSNILSAYYENEEEVVTKALRDVQIGEELTDNYDTY